MEWGALKGPSLGAKKGDGKDSFDAPDEEKIDGIVPELTERQQDWGEDWGLDWFFECVTADSEEYFLGNE